MVEALHPRPVRADIMLGPQGSERLALSRQFPDEVLDSAIMRIPSCRAADDRHTHLREEFPVRIEVLRCGIEELESRQVRCPSAIPDDRRVESSAEFVDGDHVLHIVADEGDRFLDRIEHPEQRLVRWTLSGHGTSSATRGRNAVGGTGEINEVAPLGVVEQQSLGERFEDSRGSPSDRAPFEF